MIDVGGDFDQGRSGKKNLSQSTRGSSISGMTPKYEHPGTWSRFERKMSQSTRGFFNLSDEIKIKLPGTGLNVHELD